MNTTLEKSMAIRDGHPTEAHVLAKDWYAAFSGITDAHGFPRDFASLEEVEGLMDLIFSLPNAHSFVAERMGEPVGGAVLWQGEEVAGIGPVFVRPDLQEGQIGRKLMMAAMDKADAIGQKSVRLTQSTFNRTSLALYAKLGFDVKEPLAVMQGAPLGVEVPGYSVMSAETSHLDAMDEICFAVHRHSRRAEIEGAIEHQTAKIVLRGGTMVGYATDTGFLGHAAAICNEAIYALLGAAQEFSLSGVLIPTRNAALFRWCLSHGMRIKAPSTLMARGWYHEPEGAFLPSALF